MEMRKERGGERKRSKWIAGKAIFRYDFFFASVAQLVEQVTLNHLVLGSSPSRGIAPSRETSALRAADSR